MMFIMESRLKKEEVQSHKFKSRYKFCLSVDYRGVGRERA